MTDTATPSACGVNLESITDDILQAATAQLAGAVSGAKIVISGDDYKYPEKFADTVRLLLTKKVHAAPYLGLRYHGSYINEHTFS